MLYVISHSLFLIVRSNVTQRRGHLRAGVPPVEQSVRSKDAKVLLAP